MTNEEREDLNTFRHDLIKRARWWQWKAETLEKENEQLKAENAALRERLDKAVELPCRVGDKVYCIHGMSNPEMLEWQVNEIRITDYNYMLQLGRAGPKDYRNEASQFYGKWWFTTREAALARLAEQEEKVNEETDKS